MKKIINILLITILSSGSAYLFSQSVGDPAPDFTVDLQGGGSYTLSENEGKVHLVFFFGNGCPFCVSAGPQVQEIYEDYMDNEMFAAIGLDTWNSSSSESSVSSFRNQTGITFPLALNANDVSTDYGQTYDRLLVIGQEGVIRHKGTTATANDISNVRTVIAELLASDPTPVAQVKGDSFDTEIFPQPASGFLTFTIPYGITSSAVVRIHDMTGREQLKSESEVVAGMEFIHISLPALKSGIYLYTLELEDRKTSGKLVIRHQ